MYLVSLRHDATQDCRQAVYVCVCVQICGCVHVYVCIQICGCVHGYVCTYIYVCVQICVCVHSSVCTNMWACIYLYVCIQMCGCVHIFTCVYIYPHQTEITHRKLRLSITFIGLGFYPTLIPTHRQTATWATVRIKNKEGSFNAERITRSQK